MKIVISADGPNSEAKVGHKFGTSQYLVIVDVESGNFETAPNPGASGQRGEEEAGKSEIGTDDNNYEPDG
jgi:predicted Fe-Mo cluster-binding NifX family protein